MRELVVVVVFFRDSATFFLQMLHFRKGKRVVQRILPFLNEVSQNILRSYVIPFFAFLPPVAW